MLPDSPFTGALPPFPVPVPVPDADPFVEPFYTAMWNVAWTPYILGCLYPLVLQATWDTEDTAVLWLAQKRAMSLIAGISSGWPGERPFWETEDDLDDETLPEAPWYETISDWIITAFLAVTFTPDAAIVYNSTIPRMRLVFRSGDLAGTVRVLIDGVEVLYESLYSETPGIVERIVAAVPTEGFRGLLGTEPPYVLRIEKADSDPDTKLEVVLGDIRPEDGSEVQFRQLEHCPLEFSNDGGETWTQIYSAADCVEDGIQAAIDDNRVATQADIDALGRATPPDTTEPSYGYLCAGVKAVVDKIEDYLDAVLAGIDATKEAIAIASDIAALSVAGDIIVNDVLALISDSVALTTAAIRAAKGANSLDELKERLYCLAKEDGGFFQSTFETWRQQYVGANIWKAAMIDASKMVSWLEWATIYAVAATNEDNSCEAGYTCEWCYTWDFAVSDGDWEPTVDTNNEGGATWIEGEGWQSVYNANRGTQHINLLRDFNELALTNISAEYDLIIDGETYKYHAVSVSLNASVQYAAAIPAQSGNNLYDHAFSPAIGADNITWEMRQLADSTDWCYLRSVTLHGTGDNPFGTDNCEV